MKHLRELGVYEKVDERTAVQSTTSLQSTQSGSTLTQHLRRSQCTSVHELLPESSKMETGQTCGRGLRALRAIISITASHSPGFSLVHVDVSRAYFHAKAQRPVLVKLPAEHCLGLENGNTVQTPTIDDVKDENPVWLDSEPISRYSSHVARCLFLSRDRADNIRRERVVPKNVRSSTTQLLQIETTCSVPEGRETMDTSFRTRGHEFRSDGLLGLRLGLETRKRGSRQVRGSRSWDDTF